MISLDQALDMALAHHQAGRLRQANTIYRQILEVEPRHADALALLGRIEHDEGRFEQAAGLIARAIDVDASDPTFHHNLGRALQAQGKSDAAIASYREAVRLKPDYAIAYNSLAGALVARGADAEAETAFREALRLAPDLFAAHNNLGLLLKSQRRLPEARASFVAALQVKPDLVEAHNNLGNVLRDDGRGAEAIAAYRRAIAIKPDFGSARFNLANVLARSGQFADALAELQKLVEIDPNDFEAYANMGGLWNDLGNVAAADKACRRALEIDPNSSVARGNLGVCLQAQGRLDEAIESQRAVVRACPDNPNFHSNLLYALNYQPDYDAQSVFDEHCAWAQRHADALTAEAAPHANDRTPERRLRVGYVSSHFRTHAVNFFSEPMLSAHDHAAVEVFFYSNAAPALCDAATERLRGHADVWRDIAGQNDQQVSELIRGDQIDILVDLAGHIGGNRLLVFARKPAPVQVTYLGYQNTTGMAAMDYRLTDAWSDPPGVTDRFYTERLARLPDSFFCYRPPREAPAVSPSPVATDGGATFGSFNNFAKVTPRVLATWAELLKAVPKSRLLLLAPLTEELTARVIRTFGELGVARDRVELCDRRPLDEYLQLIGRVDIALDAFPFNGHTTTCDCLWMGVPVVMLVGDNYVSRFGSSALVNLGLQDLVAGSSKEYVEIAVRLAGNSERLQSLHRDLRSMIERSPLLDAAKFTRNLEAAYRQMWVDWCGGGAAPRADAMPRAIDNRAAWGK